MSPYTSFVFAALVGLGCDSNGAPSASEQPEKIQAKKTPQAPVIAGVTGLFACKASSSPPAAKDSSNPWALPFVLGRCASIPSVFGTADFGMSRSSARKVAKADRDGFVYVGKHPGKQVFSMRFSAPAGSTDPSTG